MNLYCPKCNVQHPSTGRCPRCSSRLLSPAEAAEVIDRVVSHGPSPTQASSARHVVVGCVVALGLHLAFHEWVIGTLQLVGQTEVVVNTWTNYSLRILGAVVGGLLAGAGRPQGLWSGVVVGLVSGTAWVFVDSYPQVQIDLPIILLTGGVMCVGAVAAVFGQWMWPARRELPVPQSSRQSS